MNAYRYSISLRIKHPSISPDEISAALALVPSRSWRAGEPRATPKGTPLEGAYRESYWTSGDLCRGKWRGGDNLAKAVNALLDRFQSCRAFFHKIRAEDGKTEFFVGWYFLGNSGDVFDCDLSARLAELKIDLSLDVYPPDQPQSGI